MEEIWNSWEVKPPPVSTVKMVLKFKEMNNFKDTLFNIQKVLKNIDYLHRDAAILSRFLYKYKRIFRHDKGLQNLVKINQCLKRYLKLNLYGAINTVRLTMPAKLQKEATHAFLPTRQMLKWVLLRIQAFSQIFLRIFELSKEIGTYNYQKLLLGWSFNLTLFVFSLVSRIFISSKYLLSKSIEWYNSLYKFLPCFQSTFDFLPNYEFPDDLKKWLGNIDLSPPKSSVDKMFELIDLVGKDEDDDSESEIKIISEYLLKPSLSIRNEKVKSDKNEKVKSVQNEIIESDEDEIVEIVKEVKKHSTTKRPSSVSVSAAHVEDLGVPVDSEDEEVKELPTKKLKKNKKKFFKQGKGFSKFQ